MALKSAVIVGMIAAIGIPYALADLDTDFGRFIRDSAIRIDLGSTQIAWSWTLFALVTLFAWGFFAWANK
jgi:hypothetical protein